MADLGLEPQLCTSLHWGSEETGATQLWATRFWCLRADLVLNEQGSLFEQSPCNPQLLASLVSLEWDLQSWRENEKEMG